MRVRGAVFLVALMLCAALPPAARAQAPSTLTIPVVLSLTGLAAFVGKNEETDLHLIETVVNQSGGIDHHPVHFDIVDDGSNPQTALQFVNGIIARKAPLLLGPTLTQDCAAVAPILQEQGPVGFCLSPGLNPPAGGYIFSSSVSLRESAVVILRYFREAGMTKLALLSATDATGQEMERDLEAARTLPENKTIEFVAREHFNLTDTSVAAQLVRIKGTHPQAVLTWTGGPAFGTELRAFQDAGLDVPILGATAGMIYAQLSQYTAFMPKTLIFPGVLATGHDAVGKGPVKDALNVYFKAFKTINVKPDFASTLGWDPAMIVIDAYRHLGVNATAAQLRAYINGLHGWAGINGIYDFRDGTQHGIGGNSLIMSRWDAATSDFVPISKRAGHVK